MTDPYAIWGICLLHLNPLGKSPASTVAKPIWNLPIASAGIRGWQFSERSGSADTHTHTVNACADIWGIISELWQRELWWPISINPLRRYDVERQFLFSLPASQVWVFSRGTNNGAVPGQSLCKSDWLKCVRKKRATMQGLWLCALHRFLSKSRKINIWENPHHVLCSCIMNCVGCLEPAGKCVTTIFYPSACQHFNISIIYLLCINPNDIPYIYLFTSEY